MFIRYDETGKQVRRKVGLDCSKDKVLTEQSHKDEVDINKIIKKHGADIITKTNLLRSQDFRFDDVTGNDFQEAMLKVTKARESFESLPSQLRKQFNNNPAEYLDFVQNPDNNQTLVEMGLAQTPPEDPVIQVEVMNPPTTNPETPQE